MSLCQFRNSLGRPRQGVHAFRMGGLAAADVLGTIALALMLHYFLPKWPLLLCLVVVFGLGVLCHRIFCVNTTLDLLLFGYTDLSHARTG